MSRLIYISHPNVEIDASVPVPEWSLSDVGRRRAEAMVEQPWVSAIEAIVSSPETKAMETATILADHCGLGVAVVAGSAEINRSATGFVDHDRHEALADRLFAIPTESADGWERAVDAQERIEQALAPRIDQVRSGQTVAVIGHGGVGTLLLCRLLGLDIDRSLDQPGQGHYWAWDGDRERVRHGWRSIDHIEPALAAEPPDAPDVVELLRAHLDFANAVTPDGHVHALDLPGLMTPDITFCTARRFSGPNDGDLLSVGALRDLGERRSEIKSMHTSAAARGEGIGRLMLNHLVDLAYVRGDRWIGLETGTMEAFAPARLLYASAGFVECEPFADYTDNEFTVCMARTLR